MVLIRTRGSAALSGRRVAAPAIRRTHRGLRGSSDV